MQRVEKRKQALPSGQRKESFWQGLLTLLFWQSVFSLMLFFAVYYVKKSPIPYIENAEKFMEKAVNYNITAESIKTFAAGLFR